MFSFVFAIFEAACRQRVSLGGLCPWRLRLGTIWLSPQFQKTPSDPIAEAVDIGILEVLGQWVTACRNKYVQLVLSLCPAALSSGAVASWGGSFVGRCGGFTRRCGGIAGRRCPPRHGQRGWLRHRLEAAVVAARQKFWAVSTFWMCRTLSDVFDRF